jgi:hypothetical protein
MTQYFPVPSLSILILILLPLGCSSLEKFKSFRVSLSRIDSDKNLSDIQIIRQEILRGKMRLDRLRLAAARADQAFQAPVLGVDGAFLMDLWMGTPSKPLRAIMDTGSDLIWTQCKPCRHCFKQPTPVFDPTLSSSFNNVSCDSPLCKGFVNSKCGNGSCQYNNVYGDGSSTDGFIATDTFTFGDSHHHVSVPNLGFGCGVDNKGVGLDHAAGIVGLGRGSTSLVSQLDVQTFSYCLTSVTAKEKSSLFFGSLKDLKHITHGERLKATPLIKNPSQPLFYYLSLQGITVGDVLLPIPEQVFQIVDGAGGVILDSGTTITSLQEDAFNILAQEFITQAKLNVSSFSTMGLDVCFEVKSGDDEELKAGIPRLVFHFKGLDLELPRENYMIVTKEMGVACLAMAPTGTLSIFGNYQQQNMLVVHDLNKNTVSFIPAKCDQL